MASPASNPPAARPYGGVQADERQAERRRRLLDAGLQVMAGSDDPPELTVRAVCAQAATSARYFYESFTDKDALVAAVFDGVVADLAATTQAAVAAAPRAEQNRAGVANLVDAIGTDPRVGRLLFNPALSHPTLARKRAQLGSIFAVLSGEHAAATFRRPVDDQVAAVAHFVVGGVGQTLSAWVAGEISVTAEQLVDRLTRILNALSTDQG